MSPDVIGTVLGAGAKDALAARGDVFAMAATCHEAILTPDDAGGLSHGLRAALACRMARHNDEPALAEQFAAAVPGDDDELAKITDPDASVPSDARLRAVVRHVDLVTRSPRHATRADVDALVAAGLDIADVVRLSQLIAFVNFQVRVVAGLRLLASAS